MAPSCPLRADRNPNQGRSTHRRLGSGRLVTPKGRIHEPRATNCVLPWIGAAGGDTRLPRHRVRQCQPARRRRGLWRSEVDQGGLGRLSRVEDHRRDLRTGVGGQRFHRRPAVRHRQSRDLRARRQGPLDRPDSRVHRKPVAVLRQADQGHRSRLGAAGAVPRAARRSVDPHTVARQRPGHRRRHLRDGREVESQDHRRPRQALAGGEVRRPVGVPEPHRGPAGAEEELRPRHRARQLRRPSATAVARPRCARSSTAR